MRPIQAGESFVDRLTSMTEQINKIGSPQTDDNERAKHAGPNNPSRFKQMQPVMSIDHDSLYLATIMQEHSIE